MDLFSQKMESLELNEGDHIYTWRKYTYTHHGIYIGEGKVIHFVNPKRSKIIRISAASSSTASTSCTMSNCGSENIRGSGVRLSCIDCFIKHGSLYLYKYDASRIFFGIKIRSGTCTTAVSDPPKEVIRRATYLYQNGGYGEYHLIANNCEDFALYCKTGLWSTDKIYQGRSSQVTRFNISLLKRLFFDVNRDLGVRKDVVKVPEENLAAFRDKLYK